MGGIQQMMTEFWNAISSSLVPLVVFVTGMLVAIILGRMSKRLFIAAGVPDSVEGTTFERTVNRLGTSTTGILSWMVTLFVLALAVGLTLSISGWLDTSYYANLLRGYLLRVFVAALVLIIGLILGDKVQVEVQNWLQDIKLTEVSAIPPAAKYSILFVATLVALDELRIETVPLLIVLAGYILLLIVFGAIAFKDLLAAAASGMYLIFLEPYTIGDTIAVDDRTGIVQEVDLFTTYIESNGEEFILPNHIVMREGIVRKRS